MLYLYLDLSDLLGAEVNLNDVLMQLSEKQEDSYRYFKFVIPCRVRHDKDFDDTGPSDIDEAKSVELDPTEVAKLDQNKEALY